VTPLTEVRFFTSTPFFFYMMRTMNPLIWYVIPLVFDLLCAFTVGLFILKDDSEVVLLKHAIAYVFWVLVISLLPIINVAGIIIALICIVGFVSDNDDPDFFLNKRLN
jgi:hypothetical protein